MKNRSCASLVILAVFVFSLNVTSYAISTWVAKGPAGGGFMVDDIIIDNDHNIIYVLTGANITSMSQYDVYVSVDSGETWSKQLPLGIEPNAPVFSWGANHDPRFFDFSNFIRTNPGNAQEFYMAGDQYDADQNPFGSLFKNYSFLNSSWDDLHPGLTPPPSAFDICSGDPSYIYAGIGPAEAGTFVPMLVMSSDEGQTWTTKQDSFNPTGIPLGITALGVSPSDPNKIIMSFTYTTFLGGGLDTFEGLYISTDEGATLTQTLSLVTPESNASISKIVLREGAYPAGEVNTYAFVYGFTNTWGQMYTSTDEGRSWKALSYPSGAVHILSVDVPKVDFNTIYFVDLFDNKVFKSQDGGATWIQKSAPPSVNIRNIRVNPLVSSEVYLATNNGIYKSTDGGNSWTAKNSGFSTGSVQFLSISKPEPAKMLISTSGLPFNLRESIDYAETWGPPISQIRGVRQIAFDPSTAKTAYLLANILTGGIGLNKTTDEAATWTRLLTSILPTGEGVIAFSASEASTEIFALTRKWAFDVGGSPSIEGARVFGSTNGGASFTELADLPGSEEAGNLIVADPLSSEVVYIGGNEFYMHGLLQSTDGGNTFSPLTGPEYVNDITIDPTDSNIIYVACGSAEGGGVLWKSANLGSSWSTSFIPSSGYVNQVKVSGSNPNILYASVLVDSLMGSGVYKSPDKGATWSKISGTGLDDTNPVYALGVDPFTYPLVYAGTSNGIYKGFIDVPPPSVESISPSSGNGYLSTPVTISGDFFINLRSASLARPGNPDLVLTVESYSTTSIEALVPPSTIVGTFELAAQTDFGNSSNGPSYEVYLQAQNGPIFSNIKFDGRSYDINNPISRTPLVTGIATDEDGVSPESFSLQFFNLTYGTPKIISAPQTESPSTELPFTYEVGVLEPPLSDGNYLLRIVANDLTYEANPYGNEGVWEGYVKVYSGNVQVIGNAMVYPVPFKALGTDKLKIGYTLTQDAPVTIYIYDISGQIIMTRIYPAGALGGHAGYNMVEWNGQSDFGHPVGNGLYVGKIVSGNKVIATIKIPVLD